MKLQYPSVTSGIAQEMGHTTLLGYVTCSVSVCSNANRRQILDARVSTGFLFTSSLSFYLSWE